MQYVINEFWSEWIKEFLVTLQSSAKWKDISRNFKIGYVVWLQYDQANETRPAGNCPEY